MSEQITTFREAYEDGSQIHESPGGTELKELSEEVVNQIGLAAEKLNDDEASQDIALGIGLWVGGSDMLSRLPKPNFTDRYQPNIGLFPILDSFGKFISVNGRDILRGLKPSYVRVLAIGPDTERDDKWHCDPLIESVGGYCISRAFPNVGRIVVGVDGRLRQGSEANIRFVSGSFVVKDFAEERADCKTAEWEGLYSGYPDGSTLVTRERGSIISVGDKGFTPEQSTIHRFNDLTLTNLGCTSLHAASPSEDSVRFSLQCFYDGLE